MLDDQLVEPDDLYLSAASTTNVEQSMWIKVRLAVVAGVSAAALTDTQRICVDFVAGAACKESPRAGVSSDLNDVKFVRNPLMEAAAPVRLIKAITAD